jgi:ketosteroid isomerase-like protein
MSRYLLVLAMAMAPEPPGVTPTPAIAALTSVSLPSELDRVLRDYERAWRARDAAALARLFAEDGFVLRGGFPLVRGRDGIRAAYTGSGGPLALRALAWSSEGGTGWIIGAYGRTEGEPDSGKFVLALRKDRDGRWLITADIDNSNRRPVPPAPAPAATPAAPN